MTIKAFRVLNSGIDPELSPVLQVIGLHERYADAVWVKRILGSMAGLKDPDSSEEQAIFKRVTRCFQILENAGFCTHEGDNLYRLHPALRGCLAQMYPPPEDVKRWFVRYLAHIEAQIYTDHAQRMKVFSCHETNFFHAKILTEELDMQKEDMRLTSGLAMYAYYCSRVALAEERYRELAEKSRRYGDVDMERLTYGVLSSFAEERESRRAWMQKASEGRNGADSLDADAYFTLGYNAEKQGKLSAAEEYYKRALAIWEREENLRAIPLYGLLGSLLQWQGNKEIAIEWYQKQRREAKEKKLPFLQADASCDLGRIAAKRGNIMEAQRYYQEALTIFKALQDSRNIAVTLKDIGELFIDTGAYDLAKDALTQSVKMVESIGEKTLAAANYNALGVLSEKQGDFVSAKLWFAKALSMLKAMGDTGNAAVARRNLERTTAKINGGT